MPKKYRSGFERLAKQFQNTDRRYSEAILTIRENFNGFEEFNGYDLDHVDSLSDSQKKQIRRYYNTLTEYTEGGPVYKMAPDELPEEILAGGRRGVEQVMKAAQMGTGRKKAKYIFVNFDGDQIPQVSLRGNEIVFVNKHFGYEKAFLPLPAKDLARNAKGVIESLAPDVIGARYFRIANGNHKEFGNFSDLGALSNEIIRLQNRYAIGSKDSWTRWLSGILVYYTDKPIKQTINYITRSKESFKKRVKRESAKVRNKRK